MTFLTRGAGAAATTVLAMGAGAATTVLARGAGTPRGAARGVAMVLTAGVATTAGVCTATAGAATDLRRGDAPRGRAADLRRGCAPRTIATPRISSRLNGHFDVLYKGENG